MTIAYILFTTGAGLVILGSFFFYTILGEVNGRLPIDEQISMFGVNTKVFTVLRQHAQLFPSSRKRSQMLWIMAAGLALAGMAFLALARYAAVEGENKSPQSSMSAIGMFQQLTPLTVSVRANVATKYLLL